MGSTSSPDYMTLNKDGSVNHMSVYPAYTPKPSKSTFISKLVRKNASGETIKKCIVMITALSALLFFAIFLALVSK